MSCFNASLSNLGVYMYTYIWPAGVNVIDSNKDSFKLCRQRIDKIEMKGTECYCLSLIANMRNIH